MKSNILICILFWSCGIGFAQQDAQTFYNEGNLKFLKKEWAAALEAYDQALKLSPDLYYIFINRAETKEQLEDLDGALADYSSYINNLKERNLMVDDDVQARIRIIQDKLVQRAQGNNYPLNAEELLNADSIAVSPDEEIDQAMLAKIYYRGKASFDAGDYVSANLDFNTILRHNPRFVEALSGRGYIRLRTKDLAGAMSDFNLALSIKRLDYTSLLGRGEVKEKLLNYSGAIEDYTVAISLEPGLSPAFFNRGIAWFRMNNYSKAEEDFTITIRLQPKHDRAYFNRGLTRFNLNRNNDGCQDWKQAANLGHPRAKEYLDKYCNR